MKRKHDPEKWDGCGYRGAPKVREPYRKWFARREALMEAAEPRLLTMSRFGQNKRPVRVNHFYAWAGSRRYVSFIGVRMSAEEAMLYSPEKGFRLVKMADHPGVRLYDGTILDELAEVTRSAFLPSIFSQMYQASPFMRTLAQNAVKAGQPP